MKTYMSSQQLILVGKAWEVRYRLKSLISAGYGSTPIVLLHQCSERSIKHLKLL